MPRTLGLEGHLLRLPPKPAGQLVLKRNPLAGHPVQCPWKGGGLPAHMDAQLGGRGKGVSLDMVDREHIPRKLVGPLCVLIGRISFPVDPGEQLL